MFATNPLGFRTALALAGFCSGFCCTLGCSSDSTEEADLPTATQTTPGTVPTAVPQAPAASPSSSEAETPVSALPQTPNAGAPSDTPAEPGTPPEPTAGGPVSSTEPGDVPPTDELTPPSTPGEEVPPPVPAPLEEPPSTPTDEPSTPPEQLGSPVTRHGQLRVEGSRIVGSHGMPVTLRGQGFGWDNWWPQYYNADVVSWLRDDWCVDMIRPAMGIEPDGAYLADPDASTARITAVVDAAIANDIYVIIDWHAHDIHQSEAVEFFGQMAQRYGDQPNVIYEIFNEPDDETWPEIKAYAEAVIAAIREHDSDNLIIVGNPEWDQRIDEVTADPIAGVSNILYSVHFYAATHGDWLMDRTKSAIDAGIPVIVSESSGSEAAGTGANDYAAWQTWMDFMDENQVSWINYSVSDKAGETISVLEPGAPASGGWDASQLTETGEHIRDVFRSYCD